MYYHYLWKDIIFLLYLRNSLISTIKTFYT